MKSNTTKNYTPLVYVACPFWHESQEIRNYRRRKAIEYSERLFHRGILFYSPLLFSERFKEKKAKEGYWLQHGLRMVNVCDEMHVLCLDGWENSGGIKGEIAAAEARGCNVVYITHHTLLSFHGSRTLSLAQCAPIIEREIEKHTPEEIVTHGEPEGACEWARQLSRKHGITLKCHYLQHWRMQGQFHWRSKSVLESSEFAVFMHDGTSEGTANELKLAQKMGVPYVYYVLQDGVLVESQSENQDAKDFTIDLLQDEYEKINSAVRSSPEYQRFRKAVLSRDGGKCVFCGSDENLVVHHIIPFSKSSELAVDPVNGQTLCKSCHRSVHGKPQRIEA